MLMMGPPGEKSLHTSFPSRGYCRAAVVNAPSKKQSFTKPFVRAATVPGSPSDIDPTDRVGSPFLVPGLGRNNQQLPSIFVGLPVIRSTCFGVIPKTG